MNFFFKWEMSPTSFRKLLSLQNHRFRHQLIILYGFKLDLTETMQYVLRGRVII